MPRALILGGRGLIGTATAQHLRASGWTVDTTGRETDRQDLNALQRALGNGADLLVDCLCYTAEDAELLIPLATQATSTVMISAKAVYIDDEGRHINSDEPPRFAGPVTESQPTMAPGSMDFNSREGYGANKVAAEQTLQASGLPITILRPSKVHGPHNKRPLEWHFVRQVLQKQPRVLLAHRGEGADHPTAAANIAALIDHIATIPAQRVLNVADADAPNGRQIAAAIATAMNHEWEEVLLDHDEEGRHPWHRIPPFYLDTSAAAALGFQARDYATTVRATIEWLVENNPEPV